MLPTRPVAALCVLTITNIGALVQVTPSSSQSRQPRPLQVAVDGRVNAPSADLDATRKRFEARSIERAEMDRRRDVKLDRSLQSICGGRSGAAVSDSRKSRVRGPSRPIQ